MPSLNKITVIGNVGSEPEMRFTSGGKPVTSFYLATNRTYTVGDDKREETQWFRVVTWNRLAETCNQFLAKGKQIYVEGRLQTREWEDKEGGKRFSVEIVANSVLFLGAKTQATEETEQTNETEPEDKPF